MDIHETLNAKFTEISPLLNERQLRTLAAAEARALGHGGIKAVAQACGLSRRSIERALSESAPCQKDGSDALEEGARLSS